VIFPLGRLARYWLAFLLLCQTNYAETVASATIAVQGDTVTLANGVVEAKISKKNSTIFSFLQGQHQMVAPKKQIYYSMGGGKEYRQPRNAEFRVVRQTEDLVEVAFLQKWQPGNSQAVDIEVRYALKRGESGIHTYGILSHPANYPDSKVGEWRMVWGMPQKNDREWLMENICVDAKRNWEMPSPVDLANAKRTTIAEISEITQGVRKGMFDCKYDFNLEYYTTGCWGYASNRNRVGAWVVLGSHEFFNDGPTKQDLSSASALIHIHFGMNHYSGSSTILKAGEAWQKMYGPFLLYVNQGKSADELWQDARLKAASERKLWPHEWAGDSTLNPPGTARGRVTGKLSIHDPLKSDLGAAGAWVGLAQPPAGGNWQHESNHYQYWTKADASGNFQIPHVRPGTYTLSAFQTGAVGEYERRNITVKAGTQSIGDQRWEIPRLGRMLAWEIGTTDRRASEFRGGDRYFYGFQWKRFSSELPNPLVYEVGKSNPTRDWHYAQGAYLRGGESVAWPWKVRFDVKSPPSSGTARLTISWASAHAARVQVALNGKTLTYILPPESGGNALLRQTNHAKSSFSHVDFPVSALRPGNNEITLTETRRAGAFSHVMYDSLALELP